MFDIISLARGLLGMKRTYARMPQQSQTCVLPWRMRASSDENTKHIHPRMIAWIYGGVFLCIRLRCDDFLPPDICEINYQAPCAAAARLSVLHKSHTVATLPPAPSYTRSRECFPAELPIEKLSTHLNATQHAGYANRTGWGMPHLSFGSVC